MEFHRGSGGSLRRRARSRSIPESYGILPGTEPVIAGGNTKNNSGGGTDSRDASSVGLATSQATESEEGGTRTVWDFNSQSSGGSGSLTHPKLGSVAVDESTRAIIGLAPSGGKITQSAGRIGSTHPGKDMPPNDDSKSFGSPPAKSRPLARVRDKHSVVGDSNSDVTEMKTAATDTAPFPINVPEDSYDESTMGTDEGRLRLHRLSDGRVGQSDYSHKSQTQTAPPRLNGAGGDGVCGMMGEGPSLKRMQSECVVGVSCEDKG